MKNYTSTACAICILFFSTAVRAQTGWKWGIVSYTPSTLTWGVGFDAYQSVIDPSGNVTTSGYGIGDTLIFGTDTLPIDYSYHPMVVVKNDSSGHFLWARMSRNADAYPQGTVTDTLGNVYVMGFYSDDSVSLGPITLINPLSYPNSWSFIVKYSPSGSVLWAKNLGEAGSFGYNCLTIDASQNLYASNAFNLSSMVVGSTTLTNPHAPVWNTYIAKLDPLGNVLWAKSFGGLSLDAPLCIAVSPGGNLTMAGNFDSTALTVGSISVTNSLYPHFSSFLAGFDGSGTPVWAKEIRHAYPQQMVEGSGGNVYMTGYIDSATVLGPDTLSTSGFLLSGVNSSGSFLWSRVEGASGYDYGWGLALDRCGKIFATGQFHSSALYFGSHTLSGPGGPDPIFITEFDTTGNYINGWGLHSGGDDLSGIVVDNRGNFFVASDMMNGTGGMIFGHDTLHGSGMEAFFEAKYNYGLLGRTFSAGPICAGSTITLTDCCGGLWTSTATGIATVGSVTGVVTGVSAGTATISYSAIAGCPDLTTVTVQALPSLISGNRNICLGSTNTFTDSVAGGTWSSSSSNVTIGSSSGAATGVSLGTATLTYTLHTGCYRTVSVTVDPLPGAITGTTYFCQGQTVTLSDGTSGGTWASGSTSVATVGSLSGNVTGASAGTATITYTLPTGCYATKTVTVTSSPAPILGDLSVCVGDTTRLSDSTSGGTWITTSLITASISTTGLVTGMGAGTDLISYIISPTCIATAVVTVSPAPSPITGPSSVLVGSTITLSDLTSGGAWSSGNPSIATVGSTGIVTGVMPGVVLITYTVGCPVSKWVTVDGCPAAITGILSLCVGGSTTLSDVTTGGVWSSSSTGVATIGSLTGTVLAIGPGTTTITYSNGFCFVTAILTVNTTPPGVTGSSSVCIGSTITLLDGMPGGTWSASNSNATIGSLSGIVFGVVAGSDTISYTLASGCAASKVVTVLADPAVSAGAGIAICSGSSATLTATGATTYTWSPATGLSATTGATVIASPTVTTTYTITGNSGSCSSSATKTVSVNASPIISIGPGVTICSGSFATLTATGGTTYVWTPATGLSATTGVSVVASPTVTTTYTVTGTTASCSGTATETVTVNAAPTISAGAGVTICPGSSTTLTATGGTTYAWSPSTGLSATTGSSVTASPAITTTYTVVGTTGSCNGVATKTVTIGSSLTISAGAGVGICMGSSTPITATGGTTYTWSPSTGLSATTGATVTAHPTTTTTYTVTGSTGSCSGTATKTVSVNPLPAISAGAGVAICSGSSTIVTATGGTTYTWSPGTGLSATTGASVTASPATTTVYTVTGTTAGCSGTATKAVTVNAAPTISAGVGITICSGASATLTATGGTTYSWSPPTGLSATTGVSVIASPASTTTYTVTGTNGSCSGTATKTVTVAGALTVSAGPSIILCSGTSATLTATGATTYTWSPSTGLSATTGSSVTASPTSSITYTITGSSSGCTGTATKAVTVNTAPVVSAGAGTSVCAGSYVVLTATGAAAYTWAPPTGLSSTTGASVAASPTTTTIYTVTGTTGGCSATATKTVTVNSAPGAISGLSAICRGTTTPLTDGTTGGTWSSSNTSVATVNPSTGLVNGVNNGLVTIGYSIGACYATFPMTISPAPAAITGAGSVCLGLTITLSDPTTGGSWSSSNTAIASVSSTGVVTGAGGGMAIISYSLSGGCAATRAVSVVAVPPITGLTDMCAWGDTLMVHDSIPSGLYTSSLVTVTNLGVGNGEVMSAAAGIGTVYYTLPDGCRTYAYVTVNPLPGLITGSTHIAVGGTTTLGNSVPGGTWSSGAPAVASVGATTGLVTGIAGGVAYITYTLPTGCLADTPVHVAAHRPVTTDVEENDGRTEIHVIPNPNSGAFRITGILDGGALKDEDVYLELMDMLGQVVLRSTLHSQAGRVDEEVLAGNVANGMYVLTIRWSAGSTVAHVVVSR